MTKKERARLEARRAELEASMDYSTGEAWLDSWARCAEAYKAGDRYPAAMAARILGRNQPNGFLPPKDVMVFSRMMRAVIRHLKDPSFVLKGQVLLAYEAKKLLYEQEIAERAARGAV